MLSVLTNAEALGVEGFGSTNLARSTSTGAGLDPARLQPASPHVFVGKIAYGRRTSPTLSNHRAGGESARERARQANIGFGAISVGEIARPVLLSRPAIVGSDETRERRSIAGITGQSSAGASRAFRRTRRAREKSLRQRSIDTRRRWRRCAHSLFDGYGRPALRCFVRADKTRRTIGIGAIDIPVEVVVESVETIFRHARSAAGARTGTGTGLSGRTTGSVAAPAALSTARARSALASALSAAGRALPGSGFAAISAG